MTKNEIINALKEHRARLAKERDAMRELLSRWEDIEDSASRGINALSDSIDSLSEHL